MPTKSLADKPLARRRPRQARALHKVELILEAAVRLLERGGIEALTTNALAETAGVSIGTLYQYFADKDAVLAALTDREMGGLSQRVLENFQGVPAKAPAPGERIQAIVRAVAQAYGGRKRAHRLLMSHAMSRGGTSRLAPLYGKLIELFTAHGVASAGRTPVRLSAADAFVLTHAVAGVLRTLVAQQGEPQPPREEIEKSLAKLILGFMRAEGARGER